MQRMRPQSSEQEFRTLEYFMRNPHQGTGFLSACLFLHIELRKFPPLFLAIGINDIIAFENAFHIYILSIPCRDTERSVQEEPQ